MSRWRRRFKRSLEGMFAAPRGSPVLPSWLRSRAARCPRRPRPAPSARSMSAARVMRTAVANTAAAPDLLAVALMGWPRCRPSAFAAVMNRPPGLAAMPRHPWRPCGRPGIFALASRTRRPGPGRHGLRRDPLPRGVRGCRFTSCGNYSLLCSSLRVRRAMTSVPRLRNLTRPFVSGSRAARRSAFA